MAFCCTCENDDALTVEFPIPLAVDEAPVKDVHQVRQFEEAYKAMTKGNDGSQVPDLVDAELAKAPPPESSDQAARLQLAASTGSIATLTTYGQETKEQQDAIDDKTSKVSVTNGASTGEKARDVSQPAQGTAAESYRQPMKAFGFLSQAACLVLFAVALLVAAIVLPWWEHNDAATNLKVKMTLWHLDTSGSVAGTASINWDEYCAEAVPGTSPPECDKSRLVLIISIFMACLLALNAAFTFAVSSDRIGSEPRAKFTAFGILLLWLSMATTIFCGLYSTWYPNNTNFTDMGYAFQLVWVSAILMFFALVVAASAM